MPFGRSLAALRLAKHQRFGRFVLVGLSNTLVSYVAFLIAFALLSGFAWRTEVSQVISYLSGMGWSFVWNRRWVFASTNHAVADAVRFTISQLAMLGLSVALVSLCVDRLDLGPVFGWVLAMAAVTVVNYSVMTLLVFGKRG